MIADERTRTIVHHEWVLKTPAHHDEVAKALAVAGQKHDAEPGHPTDIEFTHGDGEIVIGYQVEQHPEATGYAVDQILRRERDTYAEQLSLARQALARHPHFDGSPIGDDVAPRITELLIHLDGRAAYFEATVQRVRALAVRWSGEDAEFGRHWHEAARLLHETLDGPDGEGPGDTGQPDDLDAFIRDEAERDPAFASGYIQAQHAAKARAFEDLLAAIWLHADWRAVTRQLTTEQRALFADAVDAHSARLAQADPSYGEPVRVERWWDA